MSDETETVENPAQEIDWKAEARKWESRSKENYAKVETYEARLAELEKAVSEKDEKAASEVASVKEEVTTAKREALKFRLAAKYQLTEEDVELFLTASDEEMLEKQAKAFSERTSVSITRPDPAQGKRDGTGAASNGEVFASLIQAELT